ncbi:hypothetical protein GH714_018220 [Hevea brasiliensis]|uniref:Uncharacterized protein n=1 Tax=Hevea brasiliensis TaxID=3981 RepID=A0A6A6LIT8_HEVBR|nr:hypothetical protein GH714_018220 [Hevea brasiliensis]
MGVRASKLGKLIGAKGVKRLVGGPPLAPREFLELLCKSAEEYGFYNEGVLRIPYEAKDFEEWMIRKTKLRITRVNPL